MPTARGDSGPGGARRRLFSARRDPRATDPDLESEIRAAHGAILDRFEQGLSEIEESARALMRSAAEDTLQGTGEGLKDLREQIARDLSRDDAVRGLIAHADERYQAIDIRVARIEGNLANVERAATALTAALGEVSDPDDAAAVLATGAVGGRIEAIEASLEDIGRSTQGLRERLDDGIAEMSTLFNEMAARTEAAAQEADDPPTLEGDVPSVTGRIEAIEASLEDIGRSTQGLRERLDDGIAEMSTLFNEMAARTEAAAQEADDSPTLEGDIRSMTDRIEAVQGYIGEVVEYLSARDQALVEWIQGIARHTDGVIAAESARVEEALTGRLDLSMLEADGRIREAVTHQVEEIHERLQEHARTLGQAISAVEVTALARLNDQDVVLAGQTQQLEAVAERLGVVRQAAVEASERVSVGLHERMADLLDQMQAESEDMRRRLVDRAAQAGADATRDIDERLGRLAELVQAALGWSVDEIGVRIHGEILRAVSVGMADFVAAMDRRFVELGTQMDERLTFISKGIDGRVEVISRKLDERLDVTDRALRAGMGVLEESITDRSTQAIDALLETRLSPTADRIVGHVDSARIGIEESVVRNVSQRTDAITRLVDERGLTAARLIEERTAELARQLEERTAELARQFEERAAETMRVVEQRAQATSLAIEERTAAAARMLEETISRGINDRVAALAAMIRSDNTAIADRLAVVEEQAAAKEAIRAIKELAAALPQQISEAMDERLAVLGELFRRENKHTVDTVARAATALADRLDKTAVVIGERFGRDVEVVVDQIGTTMQTLASGLSRAGTRATIDRQ